MKVGTFAMEAIVRCVSLLIAREALDPHLKMGGPVLNSTLPMGMRIRAALR